MDTWQFMRGRDTSTQLVARMNVCMINQICESAQRIFRSQLNEHLWIDTRDIYRKLFESLFDENTSS